jgi:hypothetical protein
MFKSYSIIVSTFDHGLDWRTAYEKGELVPVGKALLDPRLTKPMRKWIHETFVNHLDTPDGQALGLALALLGNFAAMKSEGAVIDYFIHPMLQGVIDENPDCKAAIVERDSQATSSGPVEQQSEVPHYVTDIAGWEQAKRRAAQRRGMQSKPTEN